LVALDTSTHVGASVDCYFSVLVQRFGFRVARLCGVVAGFGFPAAQHFGSATAFGLLHLIRCGSRAAFLGARQAVAQTSQLCHNKALHPTAASLVLLQRFGSTQSWS